MKISKEEITDAIKQIKEEAKDAANGKAEYMTMEEVFETPKCICLQDKYGIVCEDCVVTKGNSK